MKNHYETLGIESTADAQQIKRAYFNMVKQFPPERFPDEFKEIRAAYDALSDEASRAKYDETASLPPAASFLYGEAQKAKQRGRLEDAADIYKMIVASFPEVSFIQAEYARSLEALGKTGKAIEAWEKLCAQEPDSVTYTIALADCYDMRGWRKKAISAYVRAIEIDSSDVGCWMSLIDCHFSGGEDDDTARVSLQAVDNFKKIGKESVRVYAVAAAFGARGDPDLIERYMQDIVRLTRTGRANAEETKVSVPYLLKTIEVAGLERFTHYIRAIADTVYVEEAVRDRLARAEFRFELSRLEEEGYSLLFQELFMTLRRDCKCEECRLEITTLECSILAELSVYRPQIISMKNDFPDFFAMHAAFFNEVIRSKDTDNMFLRRYKQLPKYGNYPYTDFNFPVQQTVRREGRKIGRNEPCPCGSGKKYKKCCGR